MNLKFKADYFTLTNKRCRKGEIHELTNREEIDLLIRIGMAMPYETPTSAKDKVMAMGKELKSEIITKEEKFIDETKGEQLRSSYMSDEDFKEQKAKIESQDLTLPYLKKRGRKSKL
jgi:hypothetical protein